MFEIYKRHRPMFAVSEVKKVAHLLTESLRFDDLDLAASKIEILDISQTARINENNHYIVKSPLSHDAVMAALQKSRRFHELAVAHQNGTELLGHVLGNMIKRLQMDSYLSIGNTSIPAFQGELQQATEASKKPLLVFNDISRIDYTALDPRWFDVDHPAIWMGRDWLPAIEGTEAFFAISPELKLEVSLNRYQPLASFGDFAVGMVRL
jgi:hypothetical protein